MSVYNSQPLFLLSSNLMDIYILPLSDVLLHGDILNVNFLYSVYFIFLGTIWCFPSECLSSKKPNSLRKMLMTNLWWGFQSFGVCTYAWLIQCPLWPNLTWPRIIQKKKKCPSTYFWSSFFARLGPLRETASMAYK